VRVAYSLGMFSRDHILDEIRRLAESNNGNPVGLKRFSDETGISQYDVETYWARWGDAVSEAGLTANTLQGKDLNDEQLLQKLADHTLELGHLPTRVERRHKRLADPSFPSPTVYTRRFGDRNDLIRRTRQFASTHAGYEELISILPEPSDDATTSGILDKSKTGDFGYVYLIQMQKWFKIGFTKDILRRRGEIRLVLPEKETLVHTIETDDPSGVEQYWHNRFADRRTQGEWFQLSSADVTAFRKWRKIF